MATVTPIIRTSKKDRSGRCPIWLRVSDRDRTRFVSLGVKVLPSQWNPRKQRVRKGHPNADEINELINYRLNDAEAEDLRLKRGHTYATAGHLKAVLQPSEANDFFAFAERHLADLEKRGNIGRYRRLKATLGKLRKFASAPLPFDRITPRLLTEWETLLLKKGNKQSTIATNFRDLKTLINRAIREGVVEPGDSPFLRFKITQGEASERIKLSFAQIQAIEALDLEAGSLLWHVRNYFLFAFYAAGIRFGDLAMMKAGRIIQGEDATPDRLTYRMGKTGKLQSVKITPPARRILEHYLPGSGRQKDAEAFVFPMLDGYDLSTPKRLFNARSSQNTLVNKYLKKLAAQARINEQLSTHIARHSFADAARTSGWSIYDISKAMQHSSIEMTQRYLKSFDQEGLDDAMESLFGEAV